MVPKKDFGVCQNSESKNTQHDYNTIEKNITNLLPLSLLETFWSISKRLQKEGLPV